MDSVVAENSTPNGLSTSGKHFIAATAPAIMNATLMIAGSNQKDVMIGNGAVGAAILVGVGVKHITRDWESDPHYRALNDTPYQYAVTTVSTGAAMAFGASVALGLSGGSLAALALAAAEGVILYKVAKTETYDSGNAERAWAGTIVGLVVSCAMAFGAIANAPPSPPEPVSRCWPSWDKKTNTVPAAKPASAVAAPSRS